MSRKLNRVSARITEQKSQGGSQAMLYATGLREEDLHKPQVGISAMWYDGNPCNMHLGDLAAHVKRGVVGADLVGFRFDTIGVSDGISMGTDGMSYSLQSRDLIADSIETVMNAQWYDALVALTKNESAWASLTDAQRRAVECEVRDAQLSGVALDGAQKDRYNEIAKELSELSTKFSNNVLDATKAFAHTCVDKSEVDGLPDSALEQAAQTAKTKGGHENATAADGPWMFTLDAPSYMAVRSHAKNRALREKVYRAYLARASEHFAPFVDDADRFGHLSTLSKSVGGA